MPDTEAAGHNVSAGSHRVEWGFLDDILFFFFFLVKV